MWLVLLNSALAVPPISGRWTLETPAEVIAAQQDAGLVPALASIPSPLRGMAAGVVKRSFFYCAGYDLAADATSFRLVCDSRAPIAATFGAAAQPISIEQGTATVAVTGAESSIGVLITASEGTRQSVFSLDGETLVVKVTVASPKLDAPVAWTLRYRRG